MVSNPLSKDVIGEVKSVIEPSVLVCFKNETFDKMRPKKPVIIFTTINPTIRINNPTKACPSAPDPASPKKPVSLLIISDIVFS